MAKMTKILLSVPVLGALFGAPAFAAPPTTVVGTWDVVAGNALETLIITNQGGPGAPGASKCRVVLGTIGIAPVRGYYCPGDGVVHILHNNIPTGSTVRNFTGIVSYNPTT